MFAQWILQAALKPGFVLLAALYAPAALSLSVDVKLLTPQTTEGTVAVLTAEADLGPAEQTELKAAFAEREIPFFPMGKAGRFAAFVPVPYGFVAGKHSIVVSAGEWSKSLELEVLTGNYRSEVLKVAPKHVNPGKAAAKRIQRESQLVGSLYERITPEKLWNGNFELPIASAITSPYGNKRIYNGELKSFHAGSDLKAPIGTQVRASAAGIVVMAKNLYYTGNTMLLDHGFGVFTLYAHLSNMKVKVGRRVQAQELLGLSGMTGRVTGPHLHWMAIVRRVRIDPLQLLDAVKMIEGDAIQVAKGES